MIRLEKFGEDDFDKLISWIDSEEKLVQFAGPLFTYPLNHQQLQNYLSQSKKVPYKVKLLQTGESIGHCELNFENELPRLSRILIGDESLRNKGIGSRIMQQLIHILFTTTTYSAVDLNVFDWNANAIACYQKIGFGIQPQLRTSMLVSGKEWTALNMILHKQDYGTVYRISAANN